MTDNLPAAHDALALRLAEAAYVDLREKLARLYAIDASGDDVSVQIEVDTARLRSMRSRVLEGRRRARQERGASHDQ